MFHEVALLDACEMDILGIFHLPKVQLWEWTVVWVGGWWTVWVGGGVVGWVVLWVSLSFKIEHIEFKFKPTTSTIHRVAAHYVRQTDRHPPTHPPPK
jgi:hypothetical protein